MSNEIKSETTLSIKTGIADKGQYDSISLRLILKSYDGNMLLLESAGATIFIDNLENLSQLIHDLDRLKMKWADYKSSQTISLPKEVSGIKMPYPTYPVYGDDGVWRMEPYVTDEKGNKVWVKSILL